MLIGGSHEMPSGGPPGYNIARATLRCYASTSQQSIIYERLYMKKDTRTAPAAGLGANRAETGETVAVGDDSREVAGSGAGYYWRRKQQAFG
jgi:hypothetical protein